MLPLLLAAAPVAHHALILLADTEVASSLVSVFGYIVIPLLVVFIASAVSGTFQLLRLSNKMGSAEQTLGDTNQQVREIREDMRQYHRRTDSTLLNHSERLAVLEDRSAIAPRTTWRQNIPQDHEGEGEPR